MTHLFSVEVPSPVIKKPSAWCPSVGVFRLIPDTCPDALDVIKIDQCCGSICTSVGPPFFQWRPIKYHAQFSGARSPPVTCSKSRKNCIISSIMDTRPYSSLVSSLTEDGIGLRW
jgi:hypothetical protein